jgi:hypothetical protein
LWCTKYLSYSRHPIRTLRYSKPQTLVSVKYNTCDKTKLRENPKAKKLDSFKKNSMDSIEYQGISESLCWLREELRYGNNLIDDVIVVKLMTKMGNPHPSSG